MTDTGGPELTAPPYQFRWNSAPLPDGAHSLIAEARDGADNVGRSNPVSVVVDNTPPRLTVSAAPSAVWPPNNKVVPVVVMVSVFDSIDPAPSVRLVSIQANEAFNPAADIAGAAYGTDDRSFGLRATRNGAGTGRVYTITYSASDASGNESQATTSVTVRHDQGH